MGPHGQTSRANLWNARFCFFASTASRRFPIWLRHYSKQRSVASVSPLSFFWMGGFIPANAAFCRLAEVAANCAACNGRPWMSREKGIPAGLIGWNWAAMVAVTVLISGVVMTFSFSLSVVIVLSGTAYLLLALASIKEPLLFVAIFLAGLIALPPVFLERLGAVPIYPTTLLLPMGIAIVVCRLPDFKLRFDPIVSAFACFLLFTGVSLPFVWLFSGKQVGWDSLLRWLMLAQV